MTASPDGKLLAISDFHANCVRLYDVASMSLHRTIPNVGVASLCLSFSADGSHLATSHKDSVKLWNVSSGAQVQSFFGHTDHVNNPCFSPDMTLLATPSTDTTVRLWNVSSGAIVRTFTGHTRAVFAAVFAEQGSQLVSISEDKTLRVWDVASGQQILLIQLLRPGYSLCLSANGKSVFTGCMGGDLHQCDLSNGQLLRKFDGHTNTVVQLQLSRDGSVLVSASLDGTVRFWRVADGALLRTVPLGGEARALCLA
jgi:WD40 repeat protein